MVIITVVIVAGSGERSLTLRLGGSNPGSDLLQGLGRMVPGHSFHPEYASSASAIVVVLKGL